MYYVISSFLNFATSAALGIFILFKNRRSQVNKGFFIFTMFAALWSLCYFFWQISTTEYWALFWCRALMAFAIYVPIPCLHFTYALTGLFEKYKKVLVASYLFFTVFLIADFTPYFVSHVEPLAGFKYWPIAGPLFAPFLAFWFALIIYSVVLLVREYHRQTGAIRLQLKYVALGMTLGYLGGGTNFLLWYRIPMPPYGNILVCGFIACLAYATIRYRLMDIRVVLSRFFYYIGASLFIYVAFYGMVLFYERFFGGAFTIQAYLASILTAPAMLLIFNRVSRGAYYLANKYFAFSFYSYKEIVNRVTQELSVSNDLDQVSNAIINTIKSVLRIKKTGIVLTGPSSKINDPKIADIIGLEKDDEEFLREKNPILKCSLRIKEIYLYDEFKMLEEATKTPADKKECASLKTSLRALGVAVTIPLFSGKNFIGVIILGPKKSNDAFTKEDVELLHTLSHQAGIALNNARLHRDMGDFNKTLKQKVREQAEDLLKNNERLNELLNLKKDFIQIMAHQLNAPLSIMRNAQALVKDKTISAEEGVDYIFDSLERMTNLITNYNEAFLYEGEGVSATCEKTDISKIMNRLAEEKRNAPATIRKDLKIIVEEPKFKIPPVFCHPEKISQAASRILDNAVGYTESGSITISYSRENKDEREFLKISIKDTGIGMSVDTQKKIFIKFFRGINAISTHPNGIGINLYICKKMVEGCGGALTFQSAGEGKGSTFSFSLPIFINQKTK